MSASISPDVAASCAMRHPFLSPAWFAAVDQLIAAAGDLHIPDAMKAAELDITGTGAGQPKLVHVAGGMLYAGHKGAATAITLDEALARKVFVDADTAAGI